MRIFCLTSIEAEERAPTPEPANRKHRVLEFPPNLHSDSSIIVPNPENTAATKENEKIRELKEYAFTEIEIGYTPNGKYYLFIILRNNQVYKIPMEPGKLASSDDRKNYIIDIDVNLTKEECSRLFCSEKINPRKIRIRNIKHTRNDDYAEYQKYLNDIKEHCRQNQSSIEDAFNEIKMPVNRKPLIQKIVDIRSAIFDLCDPETGCIQNVIDKGSKARYNDKTPIRWNYYLDHGNKCVYIATEFEHNDKKRYSKFKWALLAFHSNITKFDKIWFDATNLFALYAVDIRITNKNERTWTNFANGIKNLTNLKTLVFQAYLDEIPINVFEALPTSIMELNLSNNNITSIPPDISRLNNLIILDLSNNKNFADIPWKYLPESIEMLNLSNTGITEIPNDIARLTVLSDLVLPNVERIPWSSLNKNMKCLEIGLIENGLQINAFTELQRLKINDTPYEFFRDRYLPSTIEKIIFIINGMQEFKFFPNILKLTVLDLSNNKLKSFPWDCIPKCLRKLNLSNNEFVSIGSLQYWKRLTHFDISHNEIESFVNDFDKDAYENDKSKTCDEDSYKIEGLRMNLSFNKLKRLPCGFENFIPLHTLDVGYNEFYINNLNESLWNRLPKGLVYLCVSGNPIKSLPCLLKDIKLKQLDAVDCSLQNICSQIGKNLGDMEFVLNITNNKTMENLPFMPYMPLPDAVKSFEEPTTSQHKKSRLNRNYKMEIITDAKYQCNFKSQTDENRLHFETPTAEINKYFCKCCSNCGELTDEEIVEVMTAMGCKLCQDKYKDMQLWEPDTWDSRVKHKWLDLRTYDRFIHMREMILRKEYECRIKYGIKVCKSGKWISQVKTRLCKECKDLYKKLIFYVPKILTEKEVLNKKRRLDKEFCESTEKDDYLDYGNLSLLYDNHHNTESSTPIPMQDSVDHHFWEKTFSTLNSNSVSTEPSFTNENVFSSTIPVNDSESVAGIFHTTAADEIEQFVESMQDEPLFNTASAQTYRNAPETNFNNATIISHAYSINENPYENLIASSHDRAPVFHSLNADFPYQQLPYTEPSNNFVDVLVQQPTNHQPQHQQQFSDVSTTYLNQTYQTLEVNPSNFMHVDANAALPNPEQEQQPLTNMEIEELELGNLFCNFSSEDDIFF